MATLTRQLIHDAVSSTHHIGGYVGTNTDDRVRVEVRRSTDSGEGGAVVTCASDPYYAVLVDYVTR